MYWFTLDSFIGIDLSLQHQRHFVQSMDDRFSRSTYPLLLIQETELNWHQFLPITHFINLQLKIHQSLKKFWHFSLSRGHGLTLFVTTHFILPCIEMLLFSFRSVLNERLLSFFLFTKLHYLVSLFAWRLWGVICDLTTCLRGLTDWVDAFFFACGSVYTNSL